MYSQICQYIFYLFLKNYMKSFSVFIFVYFLEQSLQLFDLFAHQITLKISVLEVTVLQSSQLWPKFFKITSEKGHF